MIYFFDTDYFVGGNYFEGDDGAQNTLVFQVKSIYFRSKVNIGSGNVVIHHNIWKSKGASDQSLYYSIHNGAVTTKLIRPTNNSIVNIYITYKPSPKSINTTNALKNCLFGAIRVNRPNNTTNPHEYIYSSIILEYSQILKVI